MPFIGIDLGTSFIKGATLDIERGRIEHVRRLPFPDPIDGLDSHYLEFEPGQIVATVRELIDELAALTPNCEGVVLCTQMSCMILMDDRGNVRSNCIGWRDKRALEPHPSGAGSYYDVLKQRISEKQRLELGNELPVGAPICFLFWLAEHGRLESGAIPVSLADFVLTSLCGSPPSVDSTNAMAYGLLNLTTLQWHGEVIEQLGFHNVHWPKIRKHGEIVGSTQVSATCVPCFTPVGDHQCALAGALLATDELSLNISTGSQVSRITNRLELGDYQTRPFFGGKFINTVSHLPAGQSLNVIVDLLTELGRAQGVTNQDPWAYIAASAAAVAHTDLGAALSFFPGPCGDRGAIFNISEKNLRVGSLFRAAFESMAQNYYTCALRLWPDRSWSNLVFSGGLVSKLAILRQIIEDRFQSASRLCPVSEDTLLGLLILAMTFTGYAGSFEEATNRVRTHYDSDSRGRLTGADKDGQ